MQTDFNQELLSSREASPKGVEDEERHVLRLGRPLAAIQQDWVQSLREKLEI